jgi:hypothetical protein
MTKGTIRGVAAGLAVGLATSVCTAFAQQIPTCATYAQIGGAVDSPGDTNGTFGIPPGATVTFTLAPGTATTATWNIVGDASGSPVYAGPGGLGTTLSYTVPPGPSLPVGYYVTAIDGTATFTASCVQGVPQSVPAVEPRLLALLSGLLVLAAAVVRLGFRRRSA